MRWLADFIMRGRKQAGLVIIVSALLPLSFWLSASAASLILLRRGLADAFGLVIWALLPALAWCYFGNEPRLLLLLMGTLSLAMLLRSGWPWSRLLIISVVLGLIYVWIWSSFSYVLIDSLAMELKKQVPKALGDVYTTMSVDMQIELVSMIKPVLLGLIAALLQVTTILCLMLGRYWQGALYNPGGFSQEFCRLRLQPLWVIALLVGMFVPATIDSSLVMLMPLFSVPLVFAAFALLHGLVKQNRLASFWLVGLYIALLFFMQLIYPLLVILAIVDSLFDFRGRYTKENTASS